MKKILLVGSHSCSNRGDMAILRGLVKGLQNELYSSSLTILSREFQSSNVLFQDHDLIPDILQGEVKSFRNKLNIRIETLLIFLFSLISKNLAKMILSKRQRKFVNLLKQHDFVIQVGGSFLVDHYGVSQFEYILLSMIAEKRIYLLGHSYGPFRTLRSRMIAKYCLRRVQGNYYREANSKRILEELGVHNITKGADTAWLVGKPKEKTERSSTVAMTLRDLYPFDKDLGVTQEEFENKAANLINNLNERNIKVIIYSTCTGFGGYWKDDRIVGYKVKKKVKQQNMVDVFINDINDLELGKEFQKCDLLIGTRLHSAIIAMSFGVPAFTIYYEHKSLGIVERVLTADYCIQIPELDKPAVEQKIFSTLKELDSLKIQLDDSVHKEKEIVRNMIEEVMIKESCF